MKKLGNSDGENSKESCKSVDDGCKRRINEEGELERREEEKVFRCSKKTIRSPDISGGIGSISLEGIRELLKKEFRTQREMIKEEIRLGVESYGEMLRKDMEEMRKEMARRQGEWNEERGGAERRIGGFEEENNRVGRQGW